MNTLPSSIETYLSEAGFSGTEIAILRKLLEGDALTIREISAKTGKSPGTLDSGMKKLIGRGIIDQIQVNDVPKYTLKSLQAVTVWMQRDAESQRQILSRRCQNFELFIESIRHEKKRPDMKHYEGQDGIKKAFKILLDGARDFVQYGPTEGLEDNVPLHELYVQFSRERAKRGIFARIISHDTSFGYKFQSRDPFEHRKTVLVDSILYPFRFEKIIAGDTVACFNFRKEEACFIQFPELAEEERVFFERLWNKKTSYERRQTPKAEPLQLSLPAESFSARIFADIKGFFTSRRSLIAFAVCGLLSAVLTFALYENNSSLNLKRIQEKVLSVAATGALQFDAKDLAELHTVADIHKPEYAKVIYLLNAIKQNNEGVQYVYIMRPTEKERIWEFVADADSLDPYAKKDTNGDGKITEADHLSPPGELYDAKETAVANKKALIEPTAFPPGIDQWGELISGWAPIKDASGKTVAVLGVDKFASDVQNLTSTTFKPILSFLALFLLFVLIRLAAFNRSLFKEILELIRIRKVMIIVGLAAAASLIATFILYQYTQHLTLQRMQDKVLAIASTAAPQFDAKDLEELQVHEDWKKPEWGKVVNQLVKIRMQNPDVIYAYIIRKTKSDQNKMEFAADASSINPYANTDTDPTNDVDMNQDGKIDGSPTGGDFLGWPGQPYEEPPPEAFEAYRGPQMGKKFYEDQWGKVISGYAPIKDFAGNVVAVLAIDIKADKQKVLTNSSFVPIYVFLLFFTLFILFRLPGFNQSLFHQILRPFLNRRVAIIVGSIVFTVSAMIYGSYRYVLHITKEEVGNRLMAIAATAAPTFSADDLNQLHVKEDMKRDAYQRVFKTLNEIRNHNENIKYAYVMRPTDKQGIWEFIADADSNYNLPFIDLDFNNDGKLDSADENIYPGEVYDMKKFTPIVDEKGLVMPLISGPYTDQWGTFLDGSAPIRDKQGNSVAVLGISMDVEELYRLARSKFFLFSESKI